MFNESDIDRIIDCKSWLVKFFAKDPCNHILPLIIRVDVDVCKVHIMLVLKCNICGRDDSTSLDALTSSEEFVLIWLTFICSIRSFGLDVSIHAILQEDVSTIS